ncbi:heme-binding protein 2-like [Emydura macquarii macquarii]|uniref:heme-binding protein 2-like n=1 Tax=Emydura macquarii macquarii TaxID=1129001 RepID=UPI00352A712E
MLLRIAPFLLLALVQGAWAEREKPEFCTEVTECFTFDLICNSSDYQARLYPPSAWASTRVNDSYTAAKVTSFWRLFRYIQGRNQLGVKIPMTAPVLTRVEEAAGETQEYTISFLLPAAWRGDPPEPTEPAVFIERFPALPIYVRSFGGWLTDANRGTHILALDASLGRDALHYDRAWHYWAGYNSPMKRFKRHNEVWRLARGGLGCAPAPPPPPVIAAPPPVLCSVPPGAQ